MAKNRILYAIALIGLALFYVYCNSYMPLLVIVMLSVLTFFSIVAVIAVRKKLSVEVAAKHCYALQGSQEPAEFELIIKNDSILPVSVVAVNTELLDLSENVVVKRKIITAVASKERKSVCLSLSTDHSAAIECRIKKARCFDAFGLVPFSVGSVKRSDKLVVMPRILGESFMKSVSNAYIIDSDKFSDTQKGDDSSQVFEVRSYVPGDDVRRIHWGLSLKQDDLIVKEYSKPIAEECVVILETGLKSGNAEELKGRTDKLLSVFITLAEELITAEQSFSVKWYNSKASDLLSFDVKAREDIYPVVMEYLSQEFSDKKNSALTMCTELDYIQNDKQVYYLYDSAYCDDESISMVNEKFCLIDVTNKVSYNDEQ